MCYLTLNKNKDNYIYDNSDEYYGDELIHWYDLGMKVEIIEEDKKIEKLYGEPRHIYSENELYIVNKINEIIDYINGSEIK